MSVIQEIKGAEHLLNSGGEISSAGLANTGATYRSGGQTNYTLTLTGSYANTGSTTLSGVGYTITPTGVTVGTASDQTKSPGQVAYENRKARLIGVIKSLTQTSPNWSGLSTRTDPLSAENAEAFIRCLPGNALLPRVTPDGEGDVLFVWEGQAQPSCVVTVEQRVLHLAFGLGTPQEKHVGEQRFLGVRIPSAILDHLPLK